MKKKKEEKEQPRGYRRDKGATYLASDHYATSIKTQNKPVQLITVPTELTLDICKHTTLDFIANRNERWGHAQRAEGTEAVVANAEDRQEMIRVIGNRYKASLGKVLFVCVLLGNVHYAQYIMESRSTDPSLSESKSTYSRAPSAH